MKRNYWVALALAACSSYSYSELVTGTTENAAATAHQWVMTNVLPQQAGLVVNGIVYRYTTVKDQNDNMIVSIQNENALGDGYVFQNKDDWSGLPGNTIRKALPINDVLIDYWGKGEITVEGKGSVKDATVVYTYRYDTCYDPLTNPECPGYKQQWDDVLAAIANEITVEDPLSNEFIKRELERKAELEEEKKEQAKQEDKKKEERREAGVKAAGNTLLTAEAIAAAQQLEALNNIPNFQTYYVSIPGGAYADLHVMAQTRIPENKKALRVGLAQQLLHTKMVDSQYKKESK